MWSSVRRYAPNEVENPPPRLCFLELWVLIEHGAHIEVKLAPQVDEAGVEFFVPDGLCRRLLLADIRLFSVTPITKSTMNALLTTHFDIHRFLAF